jgi:hypothetical protein
MQHAHLRDGLHDEERRIINQVRRSHVHHFGGPVHLLRRRRSMQRLQLHRRLRGEGHRVIDHMHGSL